MLVVGTDGGGAQHPYWIDNLALAVRFQQELVSDYVSLARPIVLRNSSYTSSYRPATCWWRWGAREYPHRGGGRSPPLCPERQPGAEHHVGEIAQENDRSRDAAPKRPGPVTEKED